MQDQVMFEELVEFQETSFGTTFDIMVQMQDKT
jgi:hypothetical protein